MFRYDAVPVIMNTLEKKKSKRGPSTYWGVIPPGGEGSMTTPKAGIGTLFWPNGCNEAWGKSGQFEYHTLHEEIFVLAGALNFDNQYKISALGYMNHPPFWLHPTNFSAEGDLTMLMRDCHAPIVQFEDIPDNWNRVEYFASGSPTRCHGVTKLQLDDLPWIDLHTATGLPTGLKAKRIWDDLDDGWITWLMRAPPNWASPGPLNRVSGGDEIYVIDGDLTLGRPERPVLGASGYVCDAHQLADGAGALSSRAGATFIRWTRGAQPIWREAGIAGRR
jgi:hypothetical protein